MLKLIHSRDGTILNEYNLKQGTYRIGRRPESDIRIDDSTVSGQHAEITVKPSEFMEGTLEVTIVDKGSTNGTSVNNRSIKKHLLKHDEIVRIGLHDLKLVDSNAGAFETTRFVLPDDDA